jgi:hypothetical protein
MALYVSFRPSTVPAPQKKILSSFEILNSNYKGL